MKIYELICISQDGNTETAGFFIKEENAKKAKEELENAPINLEYGIKYKIIPNIIMDSE